MAKHTLKILLCEHHKIFKVCLAILCIKGRKIEWGAQNGPIAKNADLPLTT